MKSIQAVKIFTIALVAAIGILFSSCDEPDTITPNNPESSELQGVLLNEFNEPVSGAIMELIQVNGSKVTTQGEEIIDSDTTDEDGNYHFKKVPSDLSNVDLVIEHPDLTPFRINLGEVIKGKDINKVIIKANYKKECCGQVTVNVLSAADSSVIEGASIKMYADTKLKRKAKSEKDGSYIFYEVCEGEYWLKVLKDGYKMSIVENVAVTGCDEKDYVEVTAFLQPENEKDSCCDGELYVIPKDKETGEVLKGALVKLRQNGEIVQKQESNDKYAEFKNVCEGEYEIVVLKDGYSGQEMNVTMKCNDKKEVVVELEKKDCCDGVMNFYLTDAETGDPIEKAEIKIYYDGKKIKIAYTDADGYVMLSGLCEGNYGGVILKEGYQETEFEVEIACNDTIKVNKTLKAKEKCTGKTEIHVSDENKNPMSGATVYLYKDNKKVGVRTTDKSGNVVFEELCEGKYLTKIFKKQYNTIEFDFYLKNGETKQFEKVLQKNEQDSCCNGVVKVYVKDKNKEPVSRAKVILWQNGKVKEYGKTNSDGYVVFDGVCEGGYGMSIEAEGFKALEFEFKMDCNETKTFEKELQKKEQDSCCNGKIIIDVNDESDNPLKYAAVYLYKGNKKVGLTKTNLEGRAVFKKVCEGEYQIVIHKDGYKEIEFKFDVGCDETKEFTKTLAKKDSCCTAVMKLVVLNGNKEVIEGAEITVYKDNDIIEEGETDSEGHWIADGLCAPATYIVVVKKDGYKTQEFRMEYAECKTLVKKVYMKE